MRTTIITPCLQRVTGHRRERHLIARRSDFARVTQQSNRRQTHSLDSTFQHVPCGLQIPFSLATQLGRNKHIPCPTGLPLSFLCLPLISYHPADLELASFLCGPHHYNLQHHCFFSLKHRLLIFLSLTKAKFDHCREFRRQRHMQT